MKSSIWLSLVLIAMSLPVFSNDDVPSVSKGTLERISPFTSQHIPSRFIDIWLPPGYSTQKKYDVLYMHDGQMLFDANTTWNHQEWKVDEVAGTLIEQNKVRPFIVVGIPNAGAGRHSEFYPQQPFNTLNKPTQNQMYQIKRSPNSFLFDGPIYSDDYLKFIVTEVVPYIESHYPVNKGAEHRYLGGSSM